MMNQRMTLQQMFPLLLALLLVAVGIVALNLDNTPAIQLGSDLLSDQAAVVNVEAFDYERAADISAMRWQAMAEAYEKAGLLNERMDAGDVSATRWQAMGRFYEEQGLLTRDAFDYAQAADDLAYRWNAMGEAYEKAGLLNDRLDPGDVAAYRWEAMAKAYERAGLLNDK